LANPVPPWKLTVTHHDEQIFEGSHHSLLFLLNSAGKAIREIEVAQWRGPSGSTTTSS